MNASKIIIYLLLIYSCGTDSGQRKIKPNKFRVVWANYVGYQPWNYADQFGILKKWADRYNIQIELVKMDYLNSVKAYFKNEFDACSMTNVDAINYSGINGSYSSVILIENYSKGNDAIFTKDKLALNELCGKNVLLTVGSVSEYLLSRALHKNNLDGDCVLMTNVKDNEIGLNFLSNKEINAVVTWNPMAKQLENEPNIKKVFSSAEIPGELVDFLIINNNTLKNNPALGKALIGAWYEVMDILEKRKTEASKDAVEFMAEAAGCSNAQFIEQLETTAMFYKADSALNFVQTKSFIEKMEFVWDFCKKHQLLYIKEIGIKYPNGSIHGDARNIRLTFDVTYLQQFIENKL